MTISASYCAECHIFNVIGSLPDLTNFKKFRNIESRYTECRCTKCRYAECRGAGTMTTIARIQAPELVQ